MHLTATAALAPAAVARWYASAEAARWGLDVDAFAAAVQASVAHAFGGRSPSAREVEEYVGSLQLDDLALAAACAHGHDRAWDHFIRDQRPGLYRAADAIDPSGGARELADSLYADLFGLRDRDGERQSLLRYYHGRSRLSTWLRAVLAQRHVDRVRVTRRHEPLPEPDRPSREVLAARPASPEPEHARFATLMRKTLTAAIAALAARDRLRLSCYYVQGMTLAAIGRVLREHEGSVSRHLTRTRTAVRADVERALRDEHGLDAATIRECVASILADPADLNVVELVGSAPIGKNDEQDRSER